MSKTKSSVWRFFASVKLALTVLIVLAATSIIGTVIKQGQAPTYYIQEYGATLARIFEATSFTNMYHSWWFVGLLALFAVNLLVCSIERLPGVWRAMVRDNLDIEAQHLAMMPLTCQADVTLDSATTADRIRKLLSGSGWRKTRRTDNNGSTLLFAQKCAWSRLGVYIVHLSILVILAGAITGSLFGMQAYVFVPEGRTVNAGLLRSSNETFPFGFDLRCDQFEKSYYPNGMVKQYRADLSVTNPASGDSFQKSVVVNDPLSYHGLTFYVGDARPLQEFLVVVRDLSTGLEQAFRVPLGREANWEDAGASLQIEELQSDEDGAVQQARISLTTATANEPSSVWMRDNSSISLQQGGAEFSLSFHQYYSTLLLITRDPGVAIVYTGFILMVIGLSISFFLSHRRLWVLIAPDSDNGQTSSVLVGGSSNKQKPAFKEQFGKFIAALKDGLPCTVQSDNRDDLGKINPRRLKRRAKTPRKTPGG